MPYKASDRGSRGFRLMAATLAVSGFSFYQQACAVTAKPEFPRLGGAKISAPQNYDDPNVQSQLARLDFVIIEIQPGWRGSGVAMRNAVQAIKAKNPDIVIADYVNVGNVHNTVGGLPAAPLRQKLDAERWWLYTSGANGTKVPSSAGGTAYSTTNHTVFVPQDDAGDRWHNWLAKYHFDQVWRHIPELDATFTDSFYWKPAVVGDWNRDGIPDSPNDTKSGMWWRQGMMAHVDQIQALMPGRLVMGNLGRSGVPEAVNTEFQGRLHGGLLERFIGETWSPEGMDMNGVVRAGSWKTMMDRYRKVMAMLALPPAPRILGFDMKGRPTDFRAFRYGFASALMDDGYFALADGTGKNLYSPKTVPWFDEYDLAGTANTKWLGVAVDAPPLSPWQNGVYRRRFQNGMALVNPRNNGDRTVTIEPGYRRFLGNQDRVVNNGSPATSITLKDRDGILLVKNAGAPPPPFDYRLSSEGPLTIVRGNSGSTTVTRTLVTGTAEPVALSISGLPSGATATLTNNACTPTCTSTLSVATTVSTPIGTYSPTLTGTPLSKTTSLTLNVQGAVTSGPASYWPYEEGAGTSAQDASGNGWTGALVNGTAWTAGARGQAVKFDGVNDQIHAGDIPASSAKTWVFWMKVSGDASRRQGLLDKYGAAREWRIYLLNGTLRLQVGKGATSYEEETATGFKAVSNAWTHVAVVFDGATGEFRVYKDGISVATSGNFPVGAIPDTTTPVHIGYRRLGGEHFSGALDELRIYNRALSTTEIQTLRAEAGP